LVLVFHPQGLYVYPAEGGSLMLLLKRGQLQ